MHVMHVLFVLFAIKMTSIIPSYIFLQLNEIYSFENPQNENKYIIPRNIDCLIKASRMYRMSLTVTLHLIRETIVIRYMMAKGKISKLNAFSHYTSSSKIVS